MLPFILIMEDNNSGSVGIKDIYEQCVSLINLYSLQFIHGFQHEDGNLSR